MENASRDLRVAAVRVLSPGWWMRDHNGELALALWPNPALAVWLVTVLIGWTATLGSARSATLAGLGRGALVVWSLDELVRGATPFRRLLGAVVLVLQLVELFGEPA
jgi:hypothetical protein